MNVAPAWRRPATALALLTAAALTASCSGGPAAQPPDASQATTTATPQAPTVKITPDEGAAKVSPEKRVIVAAAGAPLDNVTVEAGGEQLEGKYNADKTRWVSKTALKPSTSYNVSATAGVTTATSTFTTAKPERALQVVDVTPNAKGETLGVGAPIIVTFNQPVDNKATIERALEIEAEKPVEGAWRWINDTVVIYRTAKYWPAHQKVTFNADITGIKGGKGLYGVKDYTANLKIGAKQISKVDTRKKMMYVYKDGKRVQTMRISAGMATTREYTTTSGVHLTMERGNPVRMISPGRKKGDPGYYDVMINHAVRISNSGEYVHAKDNVWAQGVRNVSHGCINARPDQARWFYDNVQRGDVVDITGTDRALEWNNGWGFWQMPFSQWKKGSALNKSSKS
ncbi:L,D-transpeptidase [Nonomuraea gerenzanensis]|uniref:ErfK/YbiS/YcfS/YnhG family protein n=1 Tax=Nonomuraea gerenzanensis TaxID=93944 RepID=A0A1M4ED79_9ACTN|nr:Ig-like domain-containing protein [Nonomuraea gerenzanensis]UBU18674.1 L,D-transpeptidase family protein [Nonomuraea gerenzanensis]SBO96533.1 ErfK/YbiS/YcfS/YnhG family protein [Nonomuraea gerenzanensis]